MGEMHRCQECGSDVHEALSPRGLCPSCLLWLGLGGEGHPDDQETLLKPTPPPAPWGGASATLGSGRTFGPYRIERLLGKGGMGEVYEAEHEENGRRVALKILTRGLGDPTERARFLREGRLAASINHSHTIYIYGTEEIEGLPVITMELAPGGTLKDRVKEKGPLPPAEAVDAILQVISGLEAASAVEVLHRDVKPSNCFVDGEGQVKVGDFGLSISTLAHTERDVTATGTFLGTPAFASPEQLRCDTLDVRSDIYAVGATLYYLLTGRAPFEDDNVLKLATRIAQEAPKPVRSLRPEVAQGLARVVARCLAKTPAARFETYAALATELEPFSSTAPLPARLGVRAAAGLIDWFVLGLLLTPLALYLQWIAPDPSGATRVALYLVIGAAYFGILESRWGTTVGKALFGLRVAGPCRERPGLGRALGRGAAFVLGLQLFDLLWFWVTGAAMPATLSHPPLYVSVKIAKGYLMNAGLHFDWLLGIPLLFVTARKSNGFAGIHEFASGTRVVMKPTPDAQAVLATAPAPSPPTPTPVSMGSYQVLEHLADDLMQGYDGRLRRRVWIRRLPSGAPPLSPRRRDLSRPARLHWLNGRRTADEAWDAYEACEGASLLAVLDEPRPWGTVRHWLRDLAAELAAGLQDDSLPDLGLDRVWVTPEGQARLLDWPAPDVRARPNGAASVLPASAVDLESAQRFLNGLALSALQGRVVPPATRLDELSIGPLPLSARSFLQQLGRRSFRTPEQLAGAAASVATGPARVTRRRRLVHLAICSFVAAFLAIYTAPLTLMVSLWVHGHPDVVELAEGLEEVRTLERLQDVSEEARGEDLQEMGYEGRDLRELVRTYEVYLAGRHRGPAGDPSTWSQPFIRAEQRALAERILAAHPNPTDEEVEEARHALTPFFERVVEQHPELSTPLPAESLEAAAVPLAFLPFVAVPALLSAALFRGGLLFWALGVSIVTSAGARASRLRAFARAVIAWAPGFLLGMKLLNLPDEVAEGLPVGWFILPWEAAYVLVAASLLVGLVWAIVDPSRGLQDRLAGTCLVPR